MSTTHLTSEEAASRLGLNIETLYRWIKAGDLEIAGRAIDRGRPYLFTAEALRRCLAGKGYVVPDLERQEAGS